MEQGNQDETTKIEEVQTPNITNLSIKEAEKIVKDLGLELEIQNNSEELDKENTIITKQIPTENVSVKKGSKIFVSY